MIIAFSDADVKEYMDIILSHMEGNLVLIDKYMMGTELEVDAICDGEDVLLPGIMEHIDRAGIHSGDSIAVYPAWNLSPAKTAKLVDYSTRLALALNTKGLINIQYVICQDQVYVIEVNPRSSRTVPYLSKVTGIPMVDIATRVMLGEKLKDMPYGTYTVHQVSGWEGRELMDDFDVFIAKDAQTYRYLINNSNFESYIQVVKVTQETARSFPMRCRIPDL